jgi:hypothetical protein
MSLERRYGRPTSWRIRRTLVDLGGGSFEGEVYVKRERVDTVEWFNFGGVGGIPPDLARGTWDTREFAARKIETAKDAIEIAKPILHENDWDMTIKRVYATKVGEEWRVACEGTKDGMPQTRFLIVSSEGEPIEHVRAQLADYPPGTLRP